VFVPVFPTLLGTPLADLTAQQAIFLGMPGVADQGIDAGQAGVHALEAAVRTVVVTWLSGHCHQTAPAVDIAKLTGRNAILSIEVHRFPSLLWIRSGFVPKANNLPFRPHIVRHY
jgi:hypothetical protein